MKPIHNFRKWIFQTHGTPDVPYRSLEKKQHQLKGTFNEGSKPKPGFGTE